MTLFSTSQIERFVSNFLDENFDLPFQYVFDLASLKD